MLSLFTVSNCYHFYVDIFPCTYFVLSFMLSFLGCYHLCYHFMLSFFTVSKCYHFYVIIFPCTYFVLSFLLSFDVIIYCYHLPPFSFSWKRDTLSAGWHAKRRTQNLPYGRTQGFHGRTYTQKLSRFLVDCTAYWGRTLLILMPLGVLVMS